MYHFLKTPPFLKSYIFIGGCPRSGTTLLATLLNGSPAVCTGPEAHFKFWMLANPRRWDAQVRQRLLGDFRFKLWASEKMLDSIPDGAEMPEVFTAIAASRCPTGETHFADHTPENFHHYASLKKHYPQARFIHIIRDPRAVFASVKSLVWGPNTPTQFIRWWSRNVLMGLAPLASDDCCTAVKFEELVAHPEQTLRRISQWLNIPYEEKMLWGDAGFLPSYTKGQHALVGKSPDKGTIDSWKEKLTASEIKFIEKKLQSEMENLGYELTPGPRHTSRVRQMGWRARGMVTSLLNRRKARRRKKNSVDLKNG